MGKSRPLVNGYLERISVKAFERYQSEITDLVHGQHGVYALYKDDRLYYVGLATNLRRRVRQHLRDKHAGRWNRFSLYLVRKVDHIKEIESLLLRIADPAGNKMGGRLRSADNLKDDLRRMMEKSQRAEIAEILSDGTRRARSSPRPRRRAQPARSAASDAKNYALADICPGKRIYGTHKGKSYKAIVYRNGRIKVGTDLYDSPSAAAVALLGRAQNGWWFWHVRRKGKLVRLAELRRPK